MLLQQCPWVASATLLVWTDAPPPEWTEAERHALANSILVEYVNSYDTWYKPKTGGILTDIDSMVQMTNLSYSVPGSCECHPRPATASSF